MVTVGSWHDPFAFFAKTPSVYRFTPCKTVSQRIRLVSHLLQTRRFHPTCIFSHWPFRLQSSDYLVYLVLSLLSVCTTGFPRRLCGFFFLVSRLGSTAPSFVISFHSFIHFLYLYIASPSSCAQTRHGHHLDFFFHIASWHSSFEYTDGSIFL